MAERSRRNFQGPPPQSGNTSDDPQRAQRSDPAGRADVAAGWNRDHWSAPRDYAAQAAAGGQTGARDSRPERPTSGPIGTPEPRRYRYEMEAPQRDLHDREQLVGGHAYSGIAREAQFQRRGPRGYRRSDERIREDICEALIGMTHLDASEVTVDVSDAIVRLDGTVPERRMKHAIEDVTAGVPGVLDVENRIRVVRSTGSAES
jgi:osmotically-inducible protein OsmY